MKIATWNVNSIKARLPNVLDWLESAAPDVVLLQEIKTVDENFPAMEIEALGYNCAVHGQKSYNGVAILSKHPLEDVTRGLPGNTDDDQARYIDHLELMRAAVKASASHRSISPTAILPPARNTITNSAGWIVWPVTPRNF